MSFQFKKFTIKHSDDVFKFGTDAALLATWVEIENDKNTLEIGTGSGVITLIMAQRNPCTQYVGIDISKNAIKLAIQNLNDYPAPILANFLHSSLQDFKSDILFDHVISNPPFFENGTKSPSELRNTTRHTDTLLLEELLFHSKRLLSPNGKIDLIYPVRYLDDIKETCNKLDLHITHITFTRSTLKKPIKRVLISIGRKPSEIIETEMVINGSLKGYSTEVYNMLQPFLYKL